MNALQAAVALVGLVMFSAAAAGCAKSIEGLYPPAPAELVKPIYVINHGWHTGIAVRRADIPEGVWVEHTEVADSEYLEVGWGNREFYMAPEGTLGLALKAVLWPSPGVLHVVGFDGPVQQFFPQREIVEILVSDRGFQRLAAFIGDAYAKDGSGRTMALRRGQYANSHFYAARERYFLLKTCNTWTASALRSAGLPITSLYAVGAGNVMDQTRPLGRRINTRAAEWADKVPPSGVRQSPRRAHDPESALSPAREASGYVRPKADPSR